MVKVVFGTGTAQKTSEFTYGCDGLRRRMQVTNSDGSQTRTDYIYDGTNMVAEINTNRISTNGNWSIPVVSTYLMGASGPMYKRIVNSGSSDVRWYVADGLGSVVGEVDVNGTMTSTTSRDVYGLTRTSTGTATSRQGFVGQSCGHISDPETGGLVYMRARYYDPVVGRFTSQDPAGDGDNWFAYCGNNPISGMEFTGKVAVDWSFIMKVFSGVAGAGASAFIPGLGNITAESVAALFRDWADELSREAA